MTICLLRRAAYGFPLVVVILKFLGLLWLSFLDSLDKVSWAPLASSILDLNIRQGTSLPMPIVFEFRSGTSLGWKE